MDERLEGDRLLIELEPTTCVLLAGLLRMHGGNGGLFTRLLVSTDLDKLAITESHNSLAFSFSSLLDSGPSKVGEVCFEVGDTTFEYDTGRDGIVAIFHLPDRSTAQFKLLPVTFC